MRRLARAELGPIFRGPNGHIGGALAATAAMLLFAGASSAPAQVSPDGDQFQVNTYTTNGQYDPAVAVDGRGDFVVTWDDLNYSGNDMDGAGIGAQRYDAHGSPLGSQFQVDSWTTGFQYLSAVAADSQGRFIVAWVSETSGGDDTGDASIQARRFDANGSPIGDDFQVNTYITGEQFLPAIAMDSDGASVIVWNSDGSDGTDQSGRSIRARRFDTNGSPIGDDFQVNTYTTGTQYWTSVGMDDAGDFVIVWDSEGSNGGDTSARSIHGQRYYSTGAKVGR